MRKVAILTASLLLLVMFVNIVGQNVEGAADDPIHIDLNVKFHGKDRGTLVFLMEAGKEVDPQWKEGVPGSIDPFVNENMKRVLKALRRGGLSEERLMDSIFRNNGKIKIEDSNTTHASERNYFGFSFRANFSYDTRGIDAEYSYLDFVYDVDNMFTPSAGGVDRLFKDLAKERELRRIKIKIEISGTSSLSYTTTGAVSDHSRSVKTERISESTNAQEFLRSSNDLKVFETSFLSPGTIFISLLVFLILGYGILAYIWFRERFQGLALILPIITLIFPVVPIWTFFSPGLSFYDLAGGTIWVHGAIFFILIGACNLFNPRTNFHSFEKEKEEEPSLKMPDVVYVNKRIFVDRPVRISDEEALDPYEVIDVKRSASWEEIEKAYKSKVKEYHPDKFIASPSRIHKAAREETERLNGAYERLKKKFGK
jgi:DnaJ-like protein